MDRLQFSRNVLQNELGFQPKQIDYLFAMPGKKVFEVVFATNGFFECCVERFRKEKAKNTRFENIYMIPLSERDAKTVTVIMYSENVTTPDIKTWLSFYCHVVNVMVLRDQDGILTGARRFYVKLKRDQANGQLQHLPSTIQLGRVRGNIFYQGQPKTCRKCGSQDHLAAACNNTHCNKCKASTHTTRDCTVPMTCNLCGSDGHTFSSCPRSYANTVSNRRDPDLEANTGADDEPTPQEEVPAEEGLHTVPAQDARGAPPEDSAGPPAAEEDPDPPETSQLFSEDIRLDWSATPTEYRPADDNNISLVSVPHRPGSRADSVVMGSEECREILDSLMLQLPQPAAPAQLRSQPTVDTGMSTPQKRQLLPSSGDSADSVDLQVWPSPSSGNVSFIDPQSLDLFSSATQMKGAEVEAKWEKPKRKKSKKPRNSPSSALDPAPAPTPALDPAPAPALDPFQGLPQI